MKDLKLALSLGIPVKLSAEQAEELCNTVINLEQQLAKANERIGELQGKLESVTQEAKIQACELNTQKGIVQSVQDKFDLRVYDFNLSKALDVALNKFAIEKKIEGVKGFVKSFNFLDDAHCVNIIEVRDAALHHIEEQLRKEKE